MHLLPIHVWTQETQGCSAPSVSDLRFTIVVKRFTVNGKFSRASTTFAEDPATFFGGKVAGRFGTDEIIPKLRSLESHRSV
jgi:hypothetical protein